MSVFVDVAIARLEEALRDASKSAEPTKAVQKVIADGFKAPSVLQAGYIRVTNQDGSVLFIGIEGEDKFRISENRNAADMNLAEVGGGSIHDAQELVEELIKRIQGK